MKKRSKILALLLAMTMCTSALAGCGAEEKSSEAVSTETTSSEAAGTESKTTESAATETVVVEEPLTNAEIYPLESDKTFKVVTSGSLFSEKDSILVTEKMEEATGVDVTWSNMTYEQLQLALAGKELPDALFMFSGGLNKVTAYEYGQADYLVNFMDYLDIMPNFSALIEEHPEVLEVAQNEDGSVYLLPSFTATNTAASNMIYYRTDMLKEAGWEKTPETTEELLQCIKDLQAHYGATDSEYIAFNTYRANALNWRNTSLLNYLFASFGELVLTTFTVDSNDQVVLGAATEQYKHLMEYMNEIWESGAFNTNAYTQDTTTAQALNAADHVALNTSHTGWSLDNFASGNLEFDVMQPLTSEYWDTKHWYMAPVASIGNTCAISAQCEDIETMVKWFDAWYAPVDNALNEEGTIWGITPWLGELGEDFTFDDATMTYTKMEHAGTTECFGNMLFNGFEGGMFPYSQEANTNVGIKGRGTSDNLWPYAEIPYDLNALTLTQDEQDVYNDAFADIDAYITEMTAKFITGELDVEASWNEYISYLDKMDLQEVIKIYQAAYDRSK